MKSRVLLDTNIVIRFLTKDGGEHYEYAKSIFRDIAEKKFEVELLDVIIAEIVYVLHSFYKHTKEDIASTLKDLFAQDAIYIEKKFIILEALDIFAKKNIDFADAILCAKKNLESYEVMSFDKDIAKC